MKISKLLVVFLLFPAVTYAGLKQPVAVKGIIDLREIAAGKSFITNLNGQWEFYWSKMLHPGDFASPTELKPDCYGKVPSYWTDYSPELAKTKKMGFATYRLLVLLPPGLRQSLAFDMPVFDSSYEMYIDGKYMSGNGTPGMTEKETKPWYEKYFFRYNPVSDTMSIIINVANFHHRRGGFWLPVKIGTFSIVQRQYAASWARDWATVSLLFGFSLLFLFFFVLYPRDRLTGFFSLATFGLAIRPLFTSNYLIHNIISMSWTWIVRFEYFGLYIVLVGWYWFALIRYPSKFFRVITWIVTGVFSLCLLLTLFLPVRTFSYATSVFYPSLVVLIIYAISMNVRGILKKNTIDYVYSGAFLLLSAAAIYDVRVSLGKAGGTSGYILSYVLVLFVFTQAAMLLYKWVKSYSEREKLQGELEYVNRNLEMLVNDRTQEINARREEIERQNERIADQNRQLSDTIQLKNKIFSVVAHDLRSPVVNILYMLNLLKEKEYKEKYDYFANSSIQYAQQVITLLENMLVWGRDQEDKIKFSPERRDLADIILTNLSIFKETADKKEVSVNFTQVGNSKAFFDKDLMDIIIRNLLSNAVKYTPRGGRISILLKDKSITGEGIVLRICDNGIGIPPVKQKYLFSATEVESTPGTENERGTGFGLKLCYELVRLNNGTITVESSEGEGTCFTINLPE
ncbi:MAG: ATP-binding protein [Bacteroidota bacterium]|nr:ATP-binding protein [Bacteroidota bacterium]